MRYLCSVCSHQDDLPELPSFCPSCGTIANDLWVLGDEVNTAFSGAAQTGNPLRDGSFRSGRLLVLAGVLCLIATPVGEDLAHRQIEGATAIGQVWVRGAVVPEDHLTKSVRRLGKAQHEQRKYSNQAVRRGRGRPDTGRQSATGKLQTPDTRFIGSAGPAFPKFHKDLGSATIESENKNSSKPHSSVGIDLDVVPSLDPCPELAAPGRALIFVIDASVSMGLPADFAVPFEKILDKRINAGDEEARAIYRGFLSSPDPKRLDHARSTFADALERLDPEVLVGVVSFRSCADIDSVGPYYGYRSKRLIDHVRSLEIQRGGETAITESMASALTMLGPAGGRIVLITDGRETCSSDPCLLHDDLRADSNSIVVDVVDMTGSAPVSCLAKHTGGQIYRPGGVPNLSNIMGFVRGRLKAACTPR
ncbi:MAG: hypothetical protein CMM47_07200 [Rhodospirillaceae bacterium]|nr:hypothetical protein [Rhodospirillaceae bacterium]